MVRVNSRPRRENTPTVISTSCKQRDDRADRERKLKPERDENQNAENTEPERPERSARQFATDQRADPLRALPL